jgi:hypothetical protein
VRLGAGGMDADQASPHHKFHVIRIAAAVVAVMHPNNSDAAGQRLGDRNRGTAIRRDIANLVAAIDQRRYRRLTHNANRRPRPAGLLIFGDRQDPRQTGEAIAAQRIVNQLVSDDRRLVGRVADALQRRLPQRVRLGHAETNAIGSIRVQH